MTSAMAYTSTLFGNFTTTVYYGLYGGVNEAIVNGPASYDGLDGSYVMLSEPKMAMPVDSTDAQTQLAAIFPGATGVR